MATETPSRDWFGEDTGVSRLRGRVFEAACLGSTLLALLAVLVLLLYVFNDAIQPATADVGWIAAYVLTVAVPVLALGVYYYGRAPRAGRVAYTALGVPLAGALLAGGFMIVFLHVVSPVAWFMFLVSLGAAAAAVAGHARVRDANPLEKLAVAVVVPLLAVVGVPAVNVGPVSTPQVVPSLWDLLLALPYLPTPPIALLISFALPAALGLGGLVYRHRESERDGAVAAALGMAGAGAGLALGPLVGLNADVWIVLFTAAVLPTAVYVETVLHEGDGVAGLVLPVAVAAGVVVGTLLVQAFGFSGPETWLDWSFLSSAHSRDPNEAGIYPALVGSVMMLVVIVVSAFPVGVGAAIYLEEYAPDQGRLGAVVEFIEMNIGNLAGVPSVVYGLLGLALFIRIGDLGSGTVVVGGFTVGLLILPIVIISAQEAIRAVPDSMRQASYGMGATKWQTVRNVVLPEALPGIMTGTILALGRAIGETAPLLMIGAPAIVRIAPNSFFAKFSAMPRQIFSWSKEIDPLFRHGVMAAGVVTLLVVLLSMNAAAILVRNKYQRRS